MMITKSECCGWDVWGDLAGIGPDSGHHGVPEWVTDAPVRRPDSSTDNRRGEQPEHGTQESDEDR